MRYIEPPSRPRERTKDKDKTLDLSQNETPMNSRGLLVGVLFIITILLLALLVCAIFSTLQI